MRNYQPQKNNPYKLPTSLYRRMIDLVRDYDRIREQKSSILSGDPTGNDKLAMLSRDCEAVEKALARIPPEYHRGIMNSILYHSKYPYTAGERTYGYWKSKLAYFIAEYLGYI
ncbi:MAG: hypothetical protein J6K77_07510 [Ruminococcus sp.]|nr:hypothetical protein [Ruminococcus sp.]